MLRIYADFNDSDEQGRVRLDPRGSRTDVRAHGDALVEGLRVVLYMTDELEVEGTLVFEQIWRGIPDWSTIRYLDSR